MDTAGNARVAKRTRSLARGRGVRIVPWGAALALVLAGLQAPLQGQGRAVDASPQAPGARALVAVITDLQGGVQVEIAQGTVQEGAHRRRGADVLATLAAGDELVLAAGARLELAFTAPPAQVLSLQGPCHARVLAQGVRTREASCAPVARALDAVWEQLRIQPGLLGRASVSLRGVEEPFLRLESPLGPQLPEALGVLRWQAWPDCGPRCAYTVRLLDAAGEERLVQLTDETHFALPARLQWRAGEPCLWSVSATAPDGRSITAHAQFVLVDADTATRIAQLSAALADSPPGAGHDDTAARAEHVLLLLALEHEGLRDAARPRWAHLAQARPAFARLASARRQQ